MIYFELFYTFFIIGLCTFGGGYAMLPLIQQKVVANGWMELSEIVDFVAVSESTPGPFAVNIATYVGTETADLFGSICATLGVVLPSFLIILIVAKCYIRFKNSKLVSGAMYGLKATVVGLMAGALFGMLPEVFFPGEMKVAWENILTPQFLASLGIFGTMLVLALKKVSPIILIVASAVIGIAIGLIFNLDPMML